ncbi:hypothetical protein EYC84_007889 [Monilinia fructicola]|uniref:Uncharacterized protein n=1 Tax=Monilinia fructicola TaxID=38448 RepID=A0A5M9JM83_MONFR|nr:hypothetical protein EYC84_007889 [Monilinia fructicola]
MMLSELESFALPPDFRRTFGGEGKQLNILQQDMNDFPPLGLIKNRHLTLANDLIRGKWGHLEDVPIFT